MYNVGQEYCYSLWFASEEQKKKAKKGIMRCFSTTEEENGLVFGPVDFEVISPNDKRIKDAPPPEEGVDYKVLAGYSVIVAKEQESSPDMGFVSGLDKDDLERLRKITKKAYAKASGGMLMSDKEADEVIDQLGPQTVHNMIVNG